MTFEEAFKLLKEGKKIRCSEWYASAFWELTEEGIYITTPQGSSPVIAVFPYDFLKDNWEIYEANQDKKEELIKKIIQLVQEEREVQQSIKKGGFSNISWLAAKKDLFEFIDTLEIK